MKEFEYTDLLNFKYPDPEIEAAFPDKVNRAGQFAPFAAVTTHEAAVKETARLTDKKVELDEYSKEKINRKLIYIQDHISDEYEYTFTYFVADELKQGGKYESKSGVVTKIREYENTVVFADKCEIPIDDILIIESDVFDIIED